LILMYPILYYVVFPHPRYRHPIEPELAMLIMYVAAGSEENLMSKNLERTELLPTRSL
jgi:hypothetical protein